MAKDAYSSLDSVAEHIWAALTSAVEDRRHPWRTPILATVDESGHPCARTVVLRGVFRNSPAIEFHTDARSPKHRQLTANPNVAWAFYDAERAIQLRVLSVVSLHCGDDLARARWNELPLGCRRTYCYPAGPGTPAACPIPALSSEWHAGRPAPGDTEWAFAHFVLARCSLISWDWLYLRAEGHQRAECLYANGSAEMRWLIP